MEAVYGKREGRYNSIYPFELFSFLGLHWTSSASKDATTHTHHNFRWINFGKVISPKNLQQKKNHCQKEINIYVYVSAFWMDKPFCKEKKNQFCTCENKNKCHGSIDIAASFYPKLSTKMGKYHIFIGSIFWFLPSEIKTSKHYAITTEGSLSAMLLPFSLSFPLSEVRTPNTSRKGSGLSSVHSQTQ